MDEGGHGEKFEDAVLLALKVEEGDTSQGVQVASRSLGGKETDSALDLRVQTCSHHHFSSV